MTDNPLAEWLRDRQSSAAGLEVPAGAAPATDEDHAPHADWPDWAAPAPPRTQPETAMWDRPPERQGPRHARRGRLVLLAVLPWAVAAGLGAVALGRGGAPAVEGAPPTPAPGQVAAEAAPAAVDPALGAAAAVAVQLRVTSAGPVAGGDDGHAGDGGDRRYVDLALPEAMRWVGDVAVVTVAAVVLEGSADRWHTARRARFAVPVAQLDGQAVALGDPWVLPVGADAADGGGWEPAAADHAAVERAVAAAGYVEVAAVEVDARVDLPALLRARLRARAPGEPAARLHELWLHADPEPAVLGAAIDAGDERRTR